MSTFFTSGCVDLVEPAQGAVGEDSAAVLTPSPLACGALERVLPSDAAATQRGQLVPTDTGFLAMWYGHAATVTTGSVHLQQLDDDGNLVGSEVVTNWPHFRTASVGSRGSAHLLAVTRGTGSSPPAELVEVMHLDAAGAIVAGPWPLGPAGNYQTVQVHWLGSKWAVVYYSYPRGLFVQFVTDLGVGPPIFLGNGTAMTGMMDAAWTGSDLAVVYTPKPFSSVYWTLVTPGGVVHDVGRLLYRAPTGFYASGPTIDWGTDSFLLAWRENAGDLFGPGKATVRPYAPSGAALGPARHLDYVSWFWPAVAVKPGFVGVASVDAVVYGDPSYYDLVELSDLAVPGDKVYRFLGGRLDELTLLDLAWNGDRLAMMARRKIGSAWRIVVNTSLPCAL